MRSSAERHGRSTGSVSIAMHPEGLTLTPHLPRPRLPPTGVLTARLSNVQGNTEITYMETADRRLCILTCILDAVPGRSSPTRSSRTEGRGRPSKLWRPR